ncbi:LysR family transcriptional regulator [Intestinibacter bartlettii]|uniref:LysR family transcriptional regulator n=1 Tax=Intestinibacter bartlettii TaxID=261299 RepID=A0ABS6DY60_9FIRM|nr:LysR family transcriptional regulator [Intestinibacter bartlettii]MBU5336182.1 LysR family transcriptional regulator [Intestinibacter bartlettii]
MNLNQLYYFRTVAKFQHFRKAANELNISQPSLSLAISNLEKELGTYLFERQGRNVTLTKYGKLYLEYVEEALSILEIGEKKLKQVTSDSEGHIDIAYISPLASYFIPKKVRAFLEYDNNKSIKFTFRQGITSELIDGLKNSKYDIVFCSYVEDEDDIVFDLLFKDKLLLIVPIDHPLSKLDFIDLKDIVKYPLVSYEKNTALGKVTMDIFKKAGINPNIICQSEDENGIYGLVSEGFGIAIVADIMNPNNFKIKQIKINDLNCNRSIYMAYKKNTYQVPAVKKFIKYINSTSKDIFINDRN